MLEPVSCPRQLNRQALLWTVRNNRQWEFMLNATDHPVARTVWNNVSPRRGCRCMSCHSAITLCLRILCWRLLDNERLCFSSLSISAHNKLNKTATFNTRREETWKMASAWVGSHKNISARGTLGGNIIFRGHRLRYTRLRGSAVTLRWYFGDRPQIRSLLLFVQLSYM